MALKSTLIFEETFTFHAHSIDLIFVDMVSDQGREKLISIDNMNCGGSDPAFATIMDVAAFTFGQTGVVNRISEQASEMGGSPPTICRCGQFAAMSAAKCGKFSNFFGHNLYPTTHYGMVIRS